jgi:Ca-activated chloride channel family protein
VSSEKVDLLKSLAKKFAAEWNGEGCVSIDVVSKSSGGTATSLSGTWNETTEGMPKPVIWSPAASSWGTLVEHRLTKAGSASIIPDKAISFMVTPLVVAMPKPMADALGYPKTPVGWSDILALAQNPKGWEAKGHPEWGPFKLGKTNPNFSTSGLSALVAQNYAAAGKSADLTIEDLQNPQTVSFNKGIESSVVHYGDITMTFLNNWYRADRRGTALTYTSAVAVEEKSVIDYNLGNPDGVLAEGEEPRPPKVPLVAVYPTEGTLFSDNPLYVLEGDWVTDRQREVAEGFTEFVQSEENQRQVLKFGFRPGNPEVALGEPISTTNGVNPNEPETTLDVPAAAVLAAMLENWEQDRKEARVLIVLDVSGSMGEEADAKSGRTKLDLAKSAAVDALDQFKSTDIVGLRTFTTDADNKPLYRDLVQMAPIGPNKERLAQTITGLIPEAGTPLYEAAQIGYDTVLEGRSGSTRWSCSPTAETTTARPRTTAPNGTNCSRS